jgi:hypothetical protein
MMKVIKARKLDVHHYHGSWFEYVWEITFEDEETKTLYTWTMYTWNDYDSLEGKIITIKDDHRFEVMESC